ncbi:uncharacterized protein LOC125903002 isoform X2 [Epinephelus fuscoguttatus]|uniref:uncharacterized protein LOC125903002 isoform X2 n=1 Tax=Epinephelus fuscoguttatus TaxID=293821 RepID=UPI0020D1BC5B|nr:uncharacterized protein LOC125903002 isoform X2 [Epinephelus fuscoguttatus]
MTSVEKRRSGRKSGGHRKHSDGGYSDTSSGGSFLDETDREVSSLTDRAFRSLCIGDEAVYNDSDLGSSSPCIQRDRQLAFGQSGMDRDREDREREELKRAAHESFSLRMQQYGQDWIHGGMYGAEIQRDPQWEVYGERTQGRVSATFQHSFVETSQNEASLREEQLSFLSNGATELSSQQRRSRSRVSSLIRAFNSEGQRDGAGMDGKLREWNDEPSWDKSALMSIQRELSEFSTSYQQNFNSGHFPPAGPFSSQDTNFYSSEVAAVAHMNSASSFMRSSHSKHSMSAQVNCNSNFFIHSEFSPFKVWRDHNRFPFHRGEVSGFMHCSEFPKWYETPMYRELSLEAQPQAPYRFDERGIRHQRNNLAPAVPPSLPRPTSTSTMLQRAAAVEKRCESELTGHYPHRKRTQSLGSNRLQSQRPSTASPSSDMSRRVQDTISSVKALQQKLKMMTEQGITTGMVENQQGVFCSNDNFIPFGNNAETVAPNVVSNNTSTTPFSISQLLTPLVHPQQEVETSEVRQYAASPQPVEHAPVRAESRGATPDVRMSNYKSRATSLLFNLKDNRKRVKSTYSPTKFKGLETLEKNKQPSIQEPRDTVIDIPDFPDPDFQFPQVEEFNRANVASHQYVNQYQSPGLALTAPNSYPAHVGQYSEYPSSDYQTTHMQSEMVHQPGFTGFIPENYAGNQLANGQNLHEDLSSFTPYKQGMINNAETLGGDAYWLKPSYTVAETQRLNADNNQPREYLISKANAEQHFNETVGREFTKVDRYQQLKDNKHDYSNLSSQDRWRQTNSQDTENLSLKAAVSPWKQEITALAEKDQHAQAYQRAAMIKEELNLQRDKYRGGNQQSINTELEKIESRESFGVGTSSHKTAGVVNPNMSNQIPQYPPFSNDATDNPAYYGQQQPGAFQDKHVLQQYYGLNKENEMKDNYLTQNYNRYTDQEYRNQHMLYSNKDKSMITQETSQRKQHTPIPKMCETQSLQPVEVKPLFEHNMQKSSLSNPDNTSGPSLANQVKDRQSAEVMARTEPAMAEHIKAQHAQAELAKGQHWAQVEQPKAESARLILAGQTGSEKVKPEQAKEELTEHERVNQAEAEHIKEEKIKEERTEKSTEKQLECAREEETQAKQIREQRVTEEQRNNTEEMGAKHLKEEQGEQVKAEQAADKRPKEENIKTKQAKTEQAGQARREGIKAEQIEEEQVRAEQVERERMEAEQIGTEKVKAEQAEAERRKAEQAKLEKIQEQQTKAEQEKAKILEVGKVKANHIQAEHVKQEKAEKDSIHAGRVNEEQISALLSKAKERQAEQAKWEQTKLQLAKGQLTKTENMLDRAAKPAAKLTMTQQVKSEPDKVERVKTELAKAKAELAKIKEKMKGEQKDKIRNIVLTKENASKTDVPSKVNANKNEAHKDQDQAKQIHQQREESVVSRQSIDQANRGADDYERIREKYGFIDTTSPKGNKASAAGNVSSNDGSETPALSLDKVETMNNEKSKDKSSLTSKSAITNTENKEEVDNFKFSEVTESQYVYSESLKEFKLSSGNDLSTNVDKRANSDPVTDKLKDDRVEKLEKHDPLKHTDVTQQRDSDLPKSISLERKPKSTEHSVGPGKEQHFTPPKALSHKERAQTKQEILTSKIKAHAEKEISAIKEKGFAVRDGIMSKNSTKMLAGSQSSNIRQRPPSQEVSKKHESTMSSNITPKHQTEPSGIQMEPVKSVIPPSSATIPVKSVATTTQLVDHPQKQVPKEPMKSNDKVPKPPAETKQTGSHTMSSDEMAGNQKKQNQSGIKSPIQSKEKATKNMQDKQEANHVENSGKQKEGLKDNPAVNTDHLNKRKEAPSQATALDKAESSKQMSTEKGASKDDTVHEESAPSLNLVLSQNDTPVDDDSLQITGIMVTVRERKTSVNTGWGNNSTQEQMNAKEKECSNSEPDKHHPSSGLDVSKVNMSSREAGIIQPKDMAVQNTHSTVKEDQTEGGVNDPPENIQETSTPEATQNNVSENVTVKRTDLQQGSFSVNARPQRVTQLQEPLAEKGVPPTVTVPAKNKVLAETQPLLYKEDIIECETKDCSNETPKEIPANGIKTDEVKTTTKEKNPQTRPAAETNENFMAKVVNTAINDMNNPNRADARTLIKHDIQPSVKEDMSTVINPSNSRNTNDKSAPLVEEKRCDLRPPKPFDTPSPSTHITENENTDESPKHQYNETHSGENDPVEGEVHIGGIAIRVVPAVTEKDDLKMAGKHHVTTVPSDVAAANEPKQVASPSHEEKVSTLNNEDRSKDLTSSSWEKAMKDSLEDNLGAQGMLSSVRNLSDSLKTSSQQSSMSATSENTQAENRKPEKVTKSRKSVDESKIRPMEGDYFQVQGVEETIDEPSNCTNVGDKSDAVSKERELPGLLPNKAAISNESCTVGKNEVFILDESIRKTLESGSVGVQEENMKRKNRETDDNLASKQSDGPTERQSNKNEKTEAGQAILIRKHHTENHSSLSARERQKDRNLHPTRENTVKEKDEVKPKPKERVSTIPEISAIADYARLKVIVSEDEANTIQEFPPNKKEGFFPLIQTRHSRRPVFTVDPPDLSVKEKSLPTKTEVSSKVNKEPKPLVFPITDKEHQRTGMFKLGDKERQEKMLLDAKANEGVLDTGAKHAQHVKERHKSPTNHLKTQRREEQVFQTDTHKVCQVEQSIHQPNNPPLQATTSSSAVNTPRGTSVTQHLKPLDNSNPHEKLVGQVSNTEESTATKNEETGVKQQHRAKQVEKKQVSKIEEEKRAEDLRVKQMIEERRASLAEEERRAAQREEERRAKEREAIAIKIKERREKQKEAERRAEEERAAQKEEEMRAKQREQERRMKETEEKKRIKIEEECRAKLREEEERIKVNEERKRVKQREQERAAQEEQQRKAAQEEQQRKAAQEEQQRRAAQEEQQRRVAQEEQQRRAAQEEQKRVAQEEQQRRAAQEEQQRKAAQEEQQRRVAQEEQQRRVAQEEQQRRSAQEEQKRVAQEEQQRRAAQEEQQRKAAQEEQQRRAAQEEQRRSAQEEQQSKAEQEEQQRRAAQEEHQRRVAQEEEQKRAAQEEQKRRAAQEEQQRRVAQEEQQRRAAQEEQKRRAAQEEQQRRAAQEQQRRAAQEEQQRIAAQAEQQRRAAQEEKQRRAAQEEKQRRAQGEQQRRAAKEEKQSRAALTEEQRQAALIEVQRRAKQIEEKILADVEEKKKQREEEKAAQSSEREMIRKIQEQKIEEQRQRKERIKTQKEEEERRAAEKEKTILKQLEEKQVKEERNILLEKNKAALKAEEKRVAREQMLAQREDEIRAKKREEEKLAIHREKEKAIQLEEQKRAAQGTDALQYYAITSTESERKPRERQLCSPLPSQQRHNPSGPGSTEDSGPYTRTHRPHAPASPAPSLPRSNTSSPALGVKPSMFRVKDNTFRGSSFTKSVKPRFHKNFGEDFRVGSPMDRGSERGEEEQEIMRRSAGTPVYPDTGLNRLAAIKESSTFQPTYSSQDNLAPLPQHRPYSRRSIVFDEDDSRSVISNMSEDVESFATSAADLADVRGVYDYDRPESACSFSSDVSRSLGKPPTVPPKSEKALRRAQRLTTRRIRKELSKTAADSPAGVEKSPQEGSSIPSSSTEVRSSSRQAVASPHFSSPVSLAHAPTLGSSLPSSHTEHQSSHSSFYASPHATGPISLAVASPHATAPVSLPVAPANAAGPASHAAAPKTVAHIPSSPTLHHANHPAPVTQYHVETSYPQAYPLTQRKVLQDLGSGQYFVVDVPVQVKTKTFFDPETGKYVQLNVRESGQSTSRPQPQQTYPQPQLQPHMQVKLQQQSQASPAGKPLVLYQGNHGYPQGYQPPAINSVPHHRSSAPVTPHQDQQPVRESHIYGYPAPETGQNSEVHRYSPEKTPYMDTVNDKDKTYNRVYNTHGTYESFPECDTNSQLAGSSIYENESSAHSRYQSRDIITMGELEDFMEVSDW